MSQYFPKSFKSHFGDSIKVKIDLSNYAKKNRYQKNLEYFHLPWYFKLKLILHSHIDTSNFALKTNLANLKTEVDKLGIDKLIPIPNDLSKLSNVVKKDVVKKTVYNKLVTKVDNIDTSDFVLKIKYNTDKTELENKIPVSGFATRTQLNVV